MNELESRIQAAGNLRDALAAWQSFRGVPQLQEARFVQIDDRSFRVTGALPVGNCWPNGMPKHGCVANRSKLFNDIHDALINGVGGLIRLALANVGGENGVRPTRIVALTNSLLPREADELEGTICHTLLTLCWGNEPKRGPKCDGIVVVSKNLISVLELSAHFQFGKLSADCDIWADVPRPPPMHGC